jgi:transcriptional regulator with PAS, ATPase and Fis domain
MTQQIAEAISSVLGMDVTIVDESMVRIAGTGYYRESIGQRILQENSVYRQVLEQGKEYLITDVRTSDACESCERHATCRELAQLCCPVILGTEAIGVVGLIAFTKERQVDLAEQGKSLLEFIRKMAELIAAKVVEKDALNRLVFLKNQMETVLNFVVEGIIAVDHVARIINMNYAAEKMLRVKSKDVLGFHINEVFPGTPVAEVLREGVGFTDREVKVWHQGRQHHYLINAKPMLIEQKVQGVVASFRVAQSGQPAQTSAVEKITLNDVIGESPAVRVVKEEAKKAAVGGATVLITGESGTGKEVFAKAIHFESERGMGPFVAVNCAAIPENLLESELFGYEEGSFTGAKKGGKPGKFQIANNGTLFLDEIGDMPLTLQAKLLRVLQEKSVEPVGSLYALPVNVRIIAATHRNLEEMVAKGQFREDLYYRLNVFPLRLPPLRQRSEDIPLLVRHFLQRYAVTYHREAANIDVEAMGMLKNHQWPGNIRELENVVECAVVKSQDLLITVKELMPRLVSERSKPEIKKETENEERDKIKDTLLVFGSSVEGKAQAAASLGMSIATLYRKIRKYGL